MIQVAPKAAPAPKPTNVPTQKQDNTSKDSFYSLLSKKVNEQKPSEETKGTATEDEKGTTTQDTTLISVVQELIAQLTQDPNALVPQGNDTSSQVIPMLVTSITNQGTPQIIKPVVVEESKPIPENTTPQTELVNPLVQQSQVVDTKAMQVDSKVQQVSESVVTPIVAESQVAEALQTKQQETQPKEQAVKMPVQTDVKEPVIAPIATVASNNESDVSSHMMHAEETVATLDSEQKKPTETQQNPVEFSILNKPNTELKDPMIVKISDESSKLSPTTQTQIVDQVTAKLSENKSEFTMQLNPEHLGKVSVKLVSENGMLTVELHADNPKTQSLLLSSANEIKELVQGATHSNTHIVASNQSQEMQQNYTQQQSKQEKQQPQQQNTQDTPQSEEMNTNEFIAIMQALQDKSKYY